MNICKLYRHTQMHFQYMSKFFFWYEAGADFFRAFWNVEKMTFGPTRVQH